MTCWLAQFVVFTVTVQVRSSSVRTVGAAYLAENGTVIFDSSEKDLYPDAVPLPGVCRECSCASSHPKCEAGVSLVADGCGCCKVCARQLDEKCDLEHVCDHHKGLYCDGNSLTCKARPGRNCYVANKWHQNGATFSPSCRIACSCIDGHIACFPKCKPPPPGCAFPRLTKPSSTCCGEWRCARRPVQYLPQKESLTLRGSCVVQTTPWSPCSKTCNYGVSERVTNDNRDCRMTKETRLCIIRPCSSSARPRKMKKNCRRHTRRSKRVRYSLSGCLSTKAFRPRYCGTCRGARKCCRPSNTKTVNIEFQCKRARHSGTETYRIKRKMMLIQSCTCGDYCSNNDILSSSLGLDLHRDISPSIAT